MFQKKSPLDSPLERVATPHAKTSSRVIQGTFTRDELGSYNTNSNLSSPIHSFFYRTPKHPKRKITHIPIH